MYQNPIAGRRYVLGIDAAEGNPTSDDSAIEGVDQATGEQVASLAGKFQPATLAAYADALGGWFHGASILCERNNHGHTVLQWLKDHSRLRVQLGHDGKPGWLSNSKGKALLYDACAKAVQEQKVLLHHRTTFEQLQSIEGSSLRAPQGQHDDRADAFALALKGCHARTPASCPAGNLPWSGSLQSVPAEAAQLRRQQPVVSATLDLRPRKWSSFFDKLTGTHRHRQPTGDEPARRKTAPDAFSGVGALRRRFRASATRSRTAGSAPHLDRHTTAMRVT